MVMSIPAFLILQELDERIGNFLKTEGLHGLGRDEFSFGEGNPNLKRMYNFIRFVRALCTVHARTYLKKHLSLKAKDVLD